MSEKDFEKLKEYLENVPHAIQIYSSLGVVEIFLPLSEKQNFEDTCTVKEVRRTLGHKISISTEQKEKCMEELYTRKLKKEFDDLIKEIKNAEGDYTTLERGFKDKEKKLFERFRSIIKEKDITDNFSEKKENELKERINAELKELKERINAELKELKERCKWGKDQRIPDV